MHLTTAQTLGLTITPSLLFSEDHVIRSADQEIDLHQHLVTKSDTGGEFLHPQ
jgi:hypothetical protein